MADLLSLSHNLLSLILPVIGPIDEVLELRSVCKRFKEVTFEGSSRTGVQSWVLKNTAQQQVRAWSLLWTLNVKVLDLKYQLFTETFLETAFNHWQLEKLDVSYSPAIIEFSRLLIAVEARPELAIRCAPLAELRMSGIQRESTALLRFSQVFPNLKRLYVDNAIGAFDTAVFSSLYFSLSSLHLLHIHRTAIQWRSVLTPQRLYCDSVPSDLIPQLATALVDVKSITITELIEGYFASAGHESMLERWLREGGNLNVHKDGNLEVIKALEAMDLAGAEELVLKLVKVMCFNGLSQMGCGNSGCRHSLLNFAFERDFESVFTFLLSVNVPIYSHFEDVFAAIIKQGNEKYTNLILSQSKRLPVRPQGDCNEICISFQNKKENIGRLLLRAGFRPIKCRTHQNILLHYTDIARELLRSGDLVNTHKETIYNMIQVDVAAKREDAALSLLTEYGPQLDLPIHERLYLVFEVDRRSNFRCLSIPLSILAIVCYSQENHCDRVFAALMSLHSDPNIKDAAGWTPLLAAASYNDSVKIGMLLALNANVNETDKSRRTALHQAAQYGHLPIVQMLMDAGADPNMTSVDGDFPLDLAMDNRKQPVLDYFATRGVERRRIRQNCVLS